DEDYKQRNHLNAETLDWLRPAAKLPIGEKDFFDTRSGNMSLFGWIAKARRPKAFRNRPTTAAKRFVPRVELLEGRTLPSAAVLGLAPYSAHDPAIAAPLVAGQQVLMVHKGGSIQAVVDSAQPGAVIYIEAGHYAQAVTVATPGIQLIGLQDSQ